MNGHKAQVTDGVLRLPDTGGEAAQVAVRIRHKRGYYEGAAFSDSITFDCGRGRIPAGDWSQFGLAYYSGGLTYIKTVKLTAEQCGHQVLLDLGDARTSAEVTVNGRLMGVRLARPFAFDITSALKPGDNEIRVQVLNTLANFMSWQPTKYVYRGQTASGLLGPATLRFAAGVQVRCLPEGTVRGQTGRAQQ